MAQLPKVATLLCLTLLFAWAANGAVVLRGEGTEQLTAADIRDIGSLAAQLLPGRRLAVIDCVVSKSAGRARGISLLYVYSEPIEQTVRLWRGFQFKCVLDWDYHPPRFPEGMDHEARLARENVRRSGRWIVDGGRPVRWYAVISPADKVLPAFSTERLELFVPFDIGWGTNSGEVVDLYDLVMNAAINSGRADLSGIATVPIRYVSASRTRAEVQFGARNGRRIRFRLERNESGWRITELK